MMSAADARAFIEAQGAALVAGKGPVPRLVEVILGEPIKGSWWAHPASHGIFAVAAGGRGIRRPAGVPPGRRQGDAGAPTVVAGTRPPGAALQPGAAGADPSGAYALGQARKPDRGVSV